MDTTYGSTKGFPPHLVGALDRIRTTDEGLPAHLVAVIVRGGKVVSWAANVSKLNVYSARKAGGIIDVDRGSTHAEVRAIFRARRRSDLRGCKMYVARLTKTGEQRTQRSIIGSARPCNQCLRTIASYGIKRVIYTIGPGAFGTLAINDCGHHRRSTAARKLPHS